MSFITKRERVFNEYDLFDLPARNEGKLKAYASCTDARAWSHFCSDKSEHLIEIIKRNNDTCRTKYVPTNVIVDTLMVAKNAEIGRLKRRIEEFGQMLAAYDQLDLTCEQKCEIAGAHAAIKAANKELDELCLDLDLSGFTEGVDSDAFELSRFRGDESDKSRGDEWPFEKEPTATMENKGNQMELDEMRCDVSTSVTDPRIQEMQDTIISKDAKLNAMQNTIAVMENDVCEPYCIYAHIYTALEKIFAILCQNDKYRLYLNLMIGGKDTCCIDIKGKILFKLKVLEKFCLALIAPCSQETNFESQDCSCFRAEITFALTSAESQQPSLDNKRAHLVADIMENQEMKEILSKDNTPEKNNIEQTDDKLVVGEYNINSENLKRLKTLQENYDDLMTCYENLKHEKNFLVLRCQKYEDLELEYENLKIQLKEYSYLWNEKEHYRKRSADLDSLKEQYLTLTDETSNLETRLRAEWEINHMKTDTIEGLRAQNIAIEKKLNDSLIDFEKEKNSLQCKLKETECKVMCQEQQIKSLQVQVDKLLEQDNDKTNERDVTSHSLLLMDEIELLKEHIKNLKDALFCNEEEKQSLQFEFEDKLKIINELRMDIEDWKTTYEKTIQHNDYMKNNYEDEILRLKEENQKLMKNVELRDAETNNFVDIIEKKSQQIEKLMEENKQKNDENIELFNKINEIQDIYDNHIKLIETEKKQAVESFLLAKQESKELIDKVNDYNELVNRQHNMTLALEVQAKDYNALQDTLLTTMEQNNNLQNDLRCQKSNYSALVQEIERLRYDKNDAVNNIYNLSDENNKYKTSLELTKKNSEILKIELRDKTNELDKVMQSMQLSNTENQNLKDELIKLQQEFAYIQSSYNNLLVEKSALKNELDIKIQEHNCLHNNLKSRIDFLEDNQKAATNNIAVLQSENVQATISIKTLQKERALLIDKLKDNENLENEIVKLNISINNMREEKDKLNIELNEKDTWLANLKEIEQENEDLHKESKNLLAHSDDLEKALLHARDQLINKSTTSHDFHDTIYKEIEQMKREKLVNHNKIRDLLDKLDEADYIISTLKEDIIARNDRISILENHINQLEEEVKQLHKDVAKAVDTGEQISIANYEKMDQSLKTIEAHHSRATHDIKMELTILQNEKYKLEEQLSLTEIISQNSIRDKSKYEYQIRRFQNEREIIVTDIKQLEIESVGDSLLCPDKCDIEDILASLDRIRKILDEKNSKSCSLEQTLLKVQTSSQLLLSEAKEIVEKEKQKIINEKEEAIRDRINMEKKLNELKYQLEEQISQDKNIILNMEAKLLNQKLISDRINKSTQDYISKLEEDMQSLQNLYQSSSAKVKELEGKVEHLTEDKIKHLEMLDKIKLELEQKCGDISELQRALEKIKTREGMNIAIQSSYSNIQKTVASETDKYFQNRDNNILSSMESDNYTNSTNDKLQNQSDILLNYNDVPNIASKQKPHSVNEVQILRANIESSFDFIRISYLNYKMQRLSMGNLELYSFSNEELPNQYNNEYDRTLTTDENAAKIHTSPNFIDIYNKGSLHLNASKIKDDQKDNENNQKSKVSKSAFTNLDFTADSFETDSNNNSKKHSLSGKSTDKDLFIIYKDSGSTYEDLFHDDKKTWDGQSQILVESVTVHSKKIKTHVNSDIPVENQNKKGYNICIKEEENNDDSVKPKLNINLPRIETHSPTTSEYDKKSLDSYTIAIYSSPNPLTNLYNNNNNNGIMKKSIQDVLSIPTNSNNENYNTDSNLSLKMSLQDILQSTNETTEIANENNYNFSNESCHKLVRVSADVFVIKSKVNIKNLADKSNYDIKNKRSLENFGLQYILDSVQQETNPDNNEIKSSVKVFRKSRSDERFSKNKTPEGSESSPSKLSQLKLSSMEYKTTSNTSASKSSNESRTKSFVEQSVMAKLEDTENYDIKIQYLTKTLDNIENDYKKKIEVIKLHYDSNIKSIINKHNEGVKSIQNLHEETLQDIITRHESEVENLRTFSIEAMRRSDKLEKEVRKLKMKIQGHNSCWDIDSLKINGLDTKKRRRSRFDTKMLTKTNIEAFDVKPKSRRHGPCTCSLDINISDTIRSIFDQVDVEQRRIAENAYVKYIANKMLKSTVEALDSQELSFLHLKVCRTWKTKMSKEEALQKKINSLENELINKQCSTQQHIAELDRKVAEERRRLQKVREAIFRTPPTISRDVSPDVNAHDEPPPLIPTASEKDLMCNSNATSCNVEKKNECSKTGASNFEIKERKSAGDLETGHVNSCYSKRTRTESNRAVLGRLDAEERREKRIYSEETPTRLRRPRASHDTERKTTQRLSKPNTRT
ncbi:repetitive organellar protein-like isoform X2 [Achroia grisella]|uniref:repetitive organellar protein-like isoform X2 n=1 Tax=Achroia grisella TaxID=688607 RepID=UPI0027D2AE7E|nr:repetitive organellar protein-like isoform X2 [Achroia grisella]